MIYLAEIFHDGNAHLVRAHCEKRWHPDFGRARFDTFHWRKAAWIETRDSFGPYLMFRPNYFEVVTPQKVHEIIANRLSVEIADVAVPEGR